MIEANKIIPNILAIVLASDNNPKDKFIKITTHMLIITKVSILRNFIFQQNQSLSNPFLCHSSC